MEKNGKQTFNFSETQANNPPSTASNSPLRRRMSWMSVSYHESNFDAHRETIWGNNNLLQQPEEPQVQWIQRAYREITVFLWRTRNQGMHLHWTLWSCANFTANALKTDLDWDLDLEDVAETEPSARKNLRYRWSRSKAASEEKALRQALKRALRGFMKK